MSPTFSSKMSSGLNPQGVPRPSNPCLTIDTLSQFTPSLFLYYNLPACSETINIYSNASCVEDIVLKYTLPRFYYNIKKCSSFKRVTNY